MQNELISVIVPVYNAEAFLELCVRSILAQTYRNLEIILVNDGSQDRSGELCDMLAKEDNRIKVIHKSNVGVCGARNAGLDVAQGEFVTFVDHDDYIEANMYEYMYNQAIESSADICISGACFHADGVIRTVRIPHNKTYTPATFIETYLDNYRYFLPFFLLWNKLIRNSLLQSEKGGTASKSVRFREDVLAGEDCCFVADCLNSTSCSSPPIITTIDAPLYNHIYETNHTSLYKTYMFDSFAKCATHLRETMTEILPQKITDIDNALNFQEYEYKISKMHKAIISGQEPEYKLTWVAVTTVFRATARFGHKISALLIYILPRPLYRLTFGLYQKSFG